MVLLVRNGLLTWLALALALWPVRHFLGATSIDQPVGWFGYLAAIGVCAAFVAAGHLVRIGFARLWLPHLVQLAGISGLAIWAFQSGDPLIIQLILVGTLASATDFLFLTAGQVVLANIFLTSGYLVAITVGRSGFAPLDLIAVALAWLALLITRNIDQASYWPRGLTNQPNLVVKTSAIVGYASVAGVLAILTGLLVGWLLPDNQQDIFDLDRGSTVQLRDPLIELDKNLHQAGDPVLFDYRNAQGSGEKIRLAALPKLSDDGFAQLDMALARLPIRNFAEVSQFPPKQQTEISIKSLDTNYLPVPYAPVSVQAPGKYRYDPQTLSVLRVDLPAEHALHDFSYQVTSYPVQASDEQISGATKADPADGEVSLQLPADLDPRFTQLASEITGQANTSGQQVLALRDWLRDPARFSYDLHPPNGYNLAGLSEFLFDSHQGYCVHYAATLAILSRSLGIPARVVVGFNPGKALGDGSYQVSGYDMHAWTEVFLAGLGWQGLDATVPTSEQGTADTQPQFSAEPLPPPPPPAGQPSPNPVEPIQPEQPQPPAEQPINWWPFLGALLVILLLTSPGVARALIRKRRLNKQDNALLEAIWLELADSCTDYGVAWPGSRQWLASQADEAGDPAWQQRASGQQLTSRQISEYPWPMFSSQGQQKLTELALLVERARFAAPGSAGAAGRRVPAETLRKDLALLRGELAANASRWRKISAWVWPSSLWVQR